MKRNRMIALAACLVLTFSLVACGENTSAPQGSTAAPDAAAKSANELLTEENKILNANKDLWEKVFASMDKNVTSEIQNSNYGDFLLSALENMKGQFSDKEYETLKADAEKIREIETTIAQLPPDSSSNQPDSSVQNHTFPAFQGKDLDGNSVDQSLFSNNAFTVVNFWANSCKPCVEELSDLSALNERVKQQGGEVIGINAETMDGYEQSIQTAKQLLEKTGAKFRNIYFDSNSDAGKMTMGIVAFPTTYVFDRSGNIVGEPIVGSIKDGKNLEKLQKTIDEAIAKSAAK